MTQAWTAPPLWTVPREWAGERAFIICGGESLKAQRNHVMWLKGRVIAVKEGVLLRPDADVLFFAGEHPETIAPPLLDKFAGTHAVVRGKGHPCFPSWVKRVWRTETHEHWSTDPTMVAGFDAGTSAINLAMLFGATEIVLLGYDMSGNRWFNGEHPHPQPKIHERMHRKHMEPLASLAVDARANGVAIWNASPISRAQMFSFRPLESFLCQK